MNESQSAEMVGVVASRLHRHGCLLAVAQSNNQVLLLTIAVFFRTCCFSSLSWLPEASIPISWDTDECFKGKKGEASGYEGGVVEEKGTLGNGGDGGHESTGKKIKEDFYIHTMNITKAKKMKD